MKGSHLYARKAAEITLMVQDSAFFSSLRRNVKMNRRQKEGDAQGLPHAPFNIPLAGNRIAACCPVTSFDLLTFVSDVVVLLSRFATTSMPLKLIGYSAICAKHSRYLPRPIDRSLQQSVCEANVQHF